jgi:hypothetical protein
MAKAKKKPAPKKKAPAKKAKKAMKPQKKPGIRKKAQGKIRKAGKTAPKKKPPKKKFTAKKIRKAPPKRKPPVKKAKAPVKAAPPPLLPKSAPLAVPPIQPIVPEEHKIPKVRVPPGALVPAFDLLPEWVDRSHLHGVMQDYGLVFTAPGPGSADYTEAQELLSKCRKSRASMPGYFVVCAKQNDRLIGALDAYPSGDVLVVLRSFAASENKRDVHILMHCCALGMAKPAYVACCIERQDFASAESAGRMILMGRGLGMTALPFTHQKMLFFLRRIGREYDPLSSGPELVKVAAAMKPLCPEVAAAASGLASKGVVPLVLMPTSPDRMERLRELRDAAIMLGLQADKLDLIFETLKQQYVHLRIDITPAAV